MIRAHHESARRFLHSKYPGALLAPVRWVLAVGLRIRSQTLIARSRRM
jgi:N-acetylglucosaminyl-diphospho-decaprenol L-rhamnosyltransferase